MQATAEERKDLPPITVDDVARLSADPSARERREIAVKTAGVLGRDGLPEPARRMATEIVQALCRDVDAGVRAALAEHLKHSPLVPHDVAVQLAGDIAEVALPTLEFSSVLTDDDLMQVIACQDRDSLIAIARRAQVSEGVSDALIDTGDAAVALAVIGNGGAEISGDGLIRVLDRHGDDEAFHAPMAKRPNLPAAVVDRLMDTVAEQVRGYLIVQKALPAAFAENLLLQAREKALIGLLEADAPVCDVEDIVDRLHDAGRLTPTLLLRALFQGDLHFFETSIAAMAGVPAGNARKLIYDRGPLGLRSLLKKSRLSDDARAAIRDAVKVVKQTGFTDGAITRAEYVSRIMSRLMPGYDAAGPEGVEAYLARFGAAQ
jgi:uncharacterized protein (DUF2336 family)